MIYFQQNAIYSTSILNHFAHHGSLQMILFANFATPDTGPDWKARLSHNKCRYNGIIWIRRANLNFQA